MKKYIAIGVVLLALVVVLWVLYGWSSQAPGTQACPADAKICPDGSVVGRTGPNCAFAACPPVATTTATSTLALGQNAMVNGISMTAETLVEDSRCVVNVQCLQAGTVRVSVLMDSYNGDLTFTLGQPQVVKNMVIMLTSVTPAKHSKQTIAQSDYRFTFTLVPLVATTPGAGIP